MRYNIYLDESSIDNPTNQKMVIGGVFVMREKAKEVSKLIKKIKVAHSFHSEIKWTKVDKRKFSFYSDLASQLLSLDPEVFSFHCIVVPKNKVNYKLYHNGDKELAFFKFTYELLKQRVKDKKTYYIFPDFKPTRVRERTKNLQSYLSGHAYFNKQECIIKHVQAYDSHENVLIQIADLFCGAVGYVHNNFPEDTPKSDLTKIIAKGLNRNDLSFCSYRSENKFNIFCIDLQ